MSLLIRHFLERPVQPNKVEFSRWIVLNRPLIVESYSHYEEISCNNSFRSKIWLYCQKSKITLQKGPKSLTFYSEFFGGHIFWDKWNVEADCESFLKNLKSLPSYSMPDHKIKLYFTRSKVIQILEYLWAHIYTFTLKNTAYSQLNKEKMACLTQIFWNSHLGVTCICNYVSTIMIASKLKVFS